MLRHEYPSLREGLVGAWCPSLGATGYTLLDRSGRGNHGTLTNMGSQDNWRASGSGVALSFDGADDSVSLSKVFSGRGVVSVSLWAKPASTTSRMEVGEGPSSTDRCGYGLAEDGNAYCLPTPSGYGYCNWSSRGVSSFIHAVFVFDIRGSTNADRAKIFLMGVQQSLTFVGTVVTSAPSFGGTTALIGQRFPGGPYSSGLIDDVRIYSRALTLAEIRLLASSRGIGLVPRPVRRAALPRKAHVNVGGVWKPADTYFNVAGSWKLATPFINVGGVWK